MYVARDFHALDGEPCLLVLVHPARLLPGKLDALARLLEQDLDEVHERVIDVRAILDARLDEDRRAQLGLEGLSLGRGHLAKVVEVGLVPDDDELGARGRVLLEVLEPFLLERREVSARVTSSRVTYRKNLGTGNTGEMQVMFKATNKHAAKLMHDAQREIDRIQGAALAMERDIASKMMGVSTFFDKRNAATGTENNLILQLKDIAGKTMNLGNHVNKWLQDAKNAGSDIARWLRLVSRKTGMSIENLVAKMTTLNTYYTTQTGWERIPTLTPETIMLLVEYTKDVLKLCVESYPSFRVNQARAESQIVQFEKDLDTLRQHFFYIPYDMAGTTVQGAFFYEKPAGAKISTQSDLWTEVVNAYQRVFKELTYNIPGLCSPDMISGFFSIEDNPNFVQSVAGQPGFLWGDSTRDVHKQLDSLAEFLCMARHGALGAAFNSDTGGVQVLWDLVVQAVLDRVSGRSQLLDLDVLARMNHMTFSTVWRGPDGFLYAPFEFVDDRSWQVVVRVPWGLADSARHGVQAFYHATVAPDGTVLGQTGAGVSATWDDLYQDVMRYDGTETPAQVLARLHAFVASHFLTQWATMDVWGLLVA
nr:hypothetical protein [Candidatus Sigynarchaeota archaeon]